MVTIDGTEIVSGSTIDGQEISEITMDGDVVWTAIPDSVIAWYDATEQNASGSVSTLEDFSGEGNDLSGSATYSSSAINGNPAFEFDGDSDGFDLGGDPLIDSSMENEVTILTVQNYFGNTGGSTVDMTVVQGRDTEDFQLSKREDTSPVRWRVDNRSMNVEDGTATGEVIEVGLADGENIELRQNGTTQGTDSGSATINGGQIFELGKDGGDSGRHFNGYIGEVRIFNEKLDSDTLADQEKELSDKWGISLD